MLGRFTYLGLDFAFGVPPLLVLAHSGRNELIRHAGAVGLSVAASLAYATLAEHAAGRRRIWQASAQHTLGPRLLGAPWEEWLSIVEMGLGLSAVTVLVHRRSAQPHSD
jgi:lycopene cyclase domain-containing protein